MKILAADTSRKRSDICLWDSESEKLIIRSYEEKNNEFFFIMIDEILKESGISIEDIDILAISEGPGSFTGLRIGITSFKSFAQILDIPIFSYNSLKCLKEVAGVEGSPILDARGGRIYYLEGNETKVRMAKEVELKEPIISFDFRNLDDFFENIIKIDDNTNFSPYIAKEALRQYNLNESGDWRYIFPDYVGLSQAERERQKSE